MHGVREERENKCHHKSLGYWETRTDGTGIRRKIITSVVLRKRACGGGNESDIVQKTRQEMGRASFVGHGCPTRCFWVVEGEESRRSITRRSPSSPTPTSTSRTQRCRPNSRTPPTLRIHFHMTSSRCDSACWRCLLVPLTPRPPGAPPPISEGGITVARNGAD